MTNNNPAFPTNADEGASLMADAESEGSGVSRPMTDENGYGPAFLEGREAFKNGVQEKDCPYDIHGEWGDWADWACGWGREWCESDIDDGNLPNPIQLSKQTV